MTTVPQERMARHFNLSPDKPETWPMELINRLIWVEKNEGRPGLYRELRKALSND